MTEIYNVNSCEQKLLFGMQTLTSSSSAQQEFRTNEFSQKTLTPNADVVVGVELVKFDMYEQQCKSLKKSSTAAAEQNSRQSNGAHSLFYEMLHRSNKQHMTIRTRTAINRAELRIY